MPHSECLYTNTLTPLYVFLCVCSLLFYVTQVDAQYQSLSSVPNESSLRGLGLQEHYPAPLSLPPQIRPASPARRLHPQRHQLYSSTCQSRIRAYLTNYSYPSWLLLDESGLN